MSDLPSPKYHIGQSVYASREDTTVKQFPCPDCLGSGEWTITTPAGDTMKAACRRCSDPYSNDRDLLSLKYTEHVPGFQGLTIGSVEIKTHDYDGNPSVRYMCRETGSIWDEHRLHETSEMALAEATAKCDEANAKMALTPERTKAKRLSAYRFAEGKFEISEHLIWDAWYAYRRLREDLEGWVEETSGISKDDREAFKDILKWDIDHRDWPKLGQFIRAARRATDGDVSELSALLGELGELAIFDVEKNIARSPLTQAPCDVLPDTSAGQSAGPQKEE